MKRRQWLQWGCAHCALIGLPALAQGGDWTMPSRFARPALDTDEGGLWAMLDREETRLRRSPFRMREEKLTAYLSGIVTKLAGEHAQDIRVFPVRTPFFNASMAPNGMMQIWSGLLLRVENEAQLATVLGHEIGHYLQRHSLERLRDVKSRAAFGTVASVFGLAGALANLANAAGMYSFSREHERDADRIGLTLMGKAGYDVREAPKVWSNLIDELSAKPDGKPEKDSALFASHPASAERIEALRRMESEFYREANPGATFEAEYREQIAPFRTAMLEDEIKRGQWDESVALLTRLLSRESGNAELLQFRAQARLRRNKDKDKDIEQALADLQLAISGGKPPDACYRLLGDAHASLNDPASAREAWQHYLDLAPNAADVALIKQNLEEIK